MGKSRTIVVSSKNESPSKTANTVASSAPILGRKKQPNVASAGLAFLVAGGYTPLPLSTSGFEASSFGVNHHHYPQNKQESANNNNNNNVLLSSITPPPLTEIGTSWSTRWESCQMMRDQNLMNSAAAKKSSLGNSKIDWKLLIQLRNWVVRILNKNYSNRNHTNNKNAKEAIRCLLLGIPFSGSPVLDEDEQDDDDDVPLVCDDDGLIQILGNEAQRNNNNQSSTSATSKKEIAEQQQKRLELIAQTDDWSVLVNAAREQIVTVLDPFLMKHNSNFAVNQNVNEETKDEEENEEEESVDED